MNEQLKLYNINPSYVDQLHNLDYRVEKHHGKHSKPYLGIILKINNIHYFVPLSSPKPKHKHMYESLTFVKITNRSQLLSVLNINNIIPVPIGFYHKIDINKISDLKYRDLLNAEQIACRKKARRIIKNAKLIHKFICYEPERHKNINKFCCDFNKLEKYCRKISKEN
ncbi:type III toxin-antitoxin system ToxN/AbiQ family toxin [Lactobacillus helveticus]|uniref:type III toxin-antitoxin system ToxN/AbiQ family toxin n=1 Tax=Lactobacillus helveticus TaxID=1587 RepID=UPI0030D5B6A2